jgi:hypothetical protein
LIRGAAQDLYVPAPHGIPCFRREIADRDQASWHTLRTDYPPQETGTLAEKGAGAVDTPTLQFAATQVIGAPPA